MPLQFNVRHLERKDLHLTGELPAGELDLDACDQMIRITEPVEYDLEVQQLETSYLVRGEVRVTLDCECVRCLKPVKQELVLADWTCHLDSNGDDPVRIENDLVDLTPHLREDILLEFPQHPLCKPECGGLPQAQETKHATPREEISSVWTELNKLKL